MNRRVFNVSLLKASAAAFFTLRFARHVPADALPSSLYANAIVIDSLCAPFTDMDHVPSAETLAAVRKSGITAINFTISAPTYEDTIESLAVLQDLVDRNPDVFLIVRKHSDIARAKSESKIGIMLGFQHLISGRKARANRYLSPPRGAHHATHL